MLFAYLPYGLLSTIFGSRENDTIHQSKVNSKEDIVKLIRWDIKNKVQFNGKFYNSVDQDLYLWGIFDVVLRVEQILISSEKVVILLWCSVLSCFRPFKELIFCIIVVLKVYLAILELCFCCTDLFFIFLFFF